MFTCCCCCLTSCLFCYFLVLLYLALLDTKGALSLLDGKGKCGGNLDFFFGLFVVNKVSKLTEYVFFFFHINCVSVQVVEGKACLLCCLSFL